MYKKKNQISSIVLWKKIGKCNKIILIGWIKLFKGLIGDYSVNIFSIDFTSCFL